jgi:hypothetical protein
METIRAFEIDNPLDSNNKRIPINPIKPRGVYMGHSEPKEMMPERAGEYFFLCKNLRLEADSCLPQALNIAFGEDVFPTKRIFADSLTSSYKHSKTEKNDVLNYASQYVYVGGNKWQWSLICSKFSLGIIDFGSNNECSCLIVQKMADWSKKHKSFKNNEW